MLKIQNIPRVIRSSSVDPPQLERDTKGDTQ